MDLEIDGVPQLDDEWTCDRDAPAVGERQRREEERRSGKVKFREAASDRPDPVPIDLSRPFVGDGYPADLPPRPVKPELGPAIRTPSEAI